MSAILPSVSSARLLGERLQALRALRGLSLRDLATAAGTSAAFLSQLERGRSGATVATLARLAEALEVGLSDFFAPVPSAAHRVRSVADLPVLPGEAGYTKRLMTTAPARAFEAFLGELAPGGATGEARYTHGRCHELMVVLEGRVTLELGEERHRLGPGDSIEYLSDIPHRIVNHTDRPARVHWVIAPLQRTKRKTNP